MLSNEAGEEVGQTGRVHEGGSLKAESGVALAASYKGVY